MVVASVCSDDGTKQANQRLGSGVAVDWGKRSTGAGGGTLLMVVVVGKTPENLLVWCICGAAGQGSRRALLQYYGTDGSSWSMCSFYQSVPPSRGAASGKCSKFWRAPSLSLLARWLWGGDAMWLPDYGALSHSARGRLWPVRTDDPVVRCCCWLGSARGVEMSVDGGRGVHAAARICCCSTVRPDAAVQPCSPIEAVHNPT